MSKNVRLDNVIEIAIEQISSGGVFSFKPSGHSMEPFIFEGDLITLGAADKLKKHDIILCKKRDGGYVLHRIISIDNDFIYIRGDNQFLIEKIDPKSMCIGKVIEYVHNGKTHTHFATLPVRIWNKTTLFRKIRKLIKKTRKG